MKQNIKQRDMNIYLAATKEINLGTRSIKSKKIYSRCIKHKNKKFSNYYNITSNIIIIAFLVFKNLVAYKLLDA